MLMSYRRIVAKFGTSLLTSGTDHLDLQIMANLVKQVTQLYHQGKEIMIVSSGAIAAGRQKHRVVPEKKNTPFKQVLASVGQSRLMHAYEELFSQHNITIAQALLTKEICLTAPVTLTLVIPCWLLLSLASSVSSMKTTSSLLMKSRR